MPALAAGQEVRLPPLVFPTRPRDDPPAAPPLKPKDRALLEGMILYSDDDILVLNKPARSCRPGRNANLAAY